MEQTGNAAYERLSDIMRYTCKPTAQQIADGKKMAKDWGWIGKKQIANNASQQHSQITTNASRQHSRLQTAKKWRKIGDGLRKRQIANNASQQHSQIKNNASRQHSRSQTAKRPDLQQCKPTAQQVADGKKMAKDWG